MNQINVLSVLLIILCFIQCNSNPSENKAIDTTTHQTIENTVETQPEQVVSVNDENILGVWVLEKGGGNNTTYTVLKNSGQLVLITKVESPSMSAPFEEKDTLVKVQGKYVRSQDKDSPSHFFEITGNKFIIYDSFGVYATLISQ